MTQVPRALIASLAWKCRELEEPPGGSEINKCHRWMCQFVGVVRGGTIGMWRVLVSWIVEWLGGGDG